MSDSLIDRVVTKVTLDGMPEPASGSLAGSYSGTAGRIESDAAHWAVERYLPMKPEVLRDYLVGRDELCSGSEADFLQAIARFESILDEQAVSNHTQFASLYRYFNPDNDELQPLGASVPVSVGDPNARAEQITQLFDFCTEQLARAGYRQLERHEIEQCVGNASQWSVPLHVDFDLFERLAVFARGDVMGTRLRRRLKRFYRPEPVEVPIYQRLVVLFQMHEDDESGETLRATEVHLRLFKNIPKQDVDMLLPGSQVRISNIDRLKIFVPSVGGLLWSLRKIAHFLVIVAALTVYSTVVLTGLVLAAIGYVVRSILSYSQTKNRYLLNLTRNLYFQKLDTNLGAGYCLMQQARDQTLCELVLAYYSLLSFDGPMSRRKLKRRCERLVREAINIEIDFAADDALDRLQQMGLVRFDPASDAWRIQKPVAH